MPRKSRKLRLEQAVQLCDAWSNSAFRNDWRHRFIIDMVGKLTADKGTSTKQRNWLDSLIEEGVPSPDSKNPELSKRIEAAIATYEPHLDTFRWELGVLKDFLPRVIVGRSLSEKQLSLLERLLTESEQVASGNIWAPTPEESKNIATATLLYRGYSPMWRSERPAVRRAAEACERFLADGGFIKQGDVKKLLKAVSGRLKLVNNPRFKTGDIGKYNFGGEVQRLVCMSDVRVTTDGAIVNDWLCPDGTMKTAHADRIYKR